MSGFFIQYGNSVTVRREDTGNQAEVRNEKRIKKNIWCEWEDLVEEREIKKWDRGIKFRGRIYSRKKSLKKKLHVFQIKEFVELKSEKELLRKNKTEKKLISKQESKSETKMNTNK